MKLNKKFFLCFLRVNKILIWFYSSHVTTNGYRPHQHLCPSPTAINRHFDHLQQPPMTTTLTTYTFNHHSDHHRPPLLPLLITALTNPYQHCNHHWSPLWPPLISYMVASDHRSKNQCGDLHSPLTCYNPERPQSVCWHWFWLTFRNFSSVW